MVAFWERFLFILLQWGSILLCFSQINLIVGENLLVNEVLVLALV